MYSFLLLSHSIVRFAVLAFLVIVIILAFCGWKNKKAFSSIDNKLGLFLLIATHIQLLLGLALYFTSPNVRFEAVSMKDSLSRYWLVEHITLMIIAVVLITVTRIRSKKIADDEVRHKQLFIWNTLALALIVIAILMSGRDFFSLTM